MPDTTRPPDPGAYEGEDMKPGDPPRPATEPKGAGGSSGSDKTLTDPATGAPSGGRSNTAGAS